jgi:hypothetical protein
VVGTPTLAVREQDCDEAAARDDQLRRRRPAVAEHRVRDDRGPVRAVDVQQDGQDECGGEAGGADERGHRLAEAPRHENRDEQEHARGADHRQRRGEREPVDVRLVDHLLAAATGVAPEV